MHLSLSTCAPVRVDFQDVKVFGDKGDQGLTAETCCAEEKRINHQYKGSEGLCKKRSGKINQERCLKVVVRIDRRHLPDLVAGTQHGDSQVYLT